MDGDVLFLVNFDHDISNGVFEAVPGFLHNDRLKGIGTMTSGFIWLECSDILLQPIWAVYFVEEIV